MVQEYIPQKKFSIENDKSIEEDTENEESSNLVALQLKQLEVMNIELGAINQVNLGATLKVNGQFVYANSRQNNSLTNIWTQKLGPHTYLKPSS